MRVHERKKSRKSRFIMEKIRVSSHFQQRKQEVKNRPEIVLLDFYHHLAVCANKLVIFTFSKWEEKV